MGALLLAASLAVVACYAGPDTDHYAAILDELDVPDDWELVKTERHGPGEASDCDPIVSVGCPAVRSWYLVDRDALTTLDQLKQAIGAAGFEIEDVLLPDCRGVPQGALCSLFSRRADDRLAASVYASGSAAGIDISPTDQVVALITASR